MSFRNIQLSNYKVLSYVIGGAGYLSSPIKTIYIAYELGCGAGYFNSTINCQMGQAFFFEMFDFWDFFEINEPDICFLKCIVMLETIFLSHYNIIDLILLMW